MVISIMPSHDDEQLATHAAGERDQFRRQCVDVGEIALELMLAVLASGDDGTEFVLVHRLFHHEPQLAGVLTPAMSIEERLKAFAQVFRCRR